MKTKIPSITLLFVATALAVHAVSCPKPTNSGTCGFGPQVADPVNGCCEVSGVAQITRKECLGNSSSLKCIGSEIQQSYTWTTYLLIDPIEENVPSYCEGLAPTNPCKGTGQPNPKTESFPCKQAVDGVSECKQTSA